MDDRTLNPKRKPSSLRPRLAKGWRQRLGVLIGAIGLAVTSGSQVSGQPLQVQIQGGQVPTDEGEDFRGLHLPNDRTASRGLTLASEGIANGQFSQAIRFLDRILSEEEDAFTNLRVGASHFAGLKAEARRMLGALPQAAWQDYVSTFGATAKNRLAAAVAAGDVAEIERIARQFFHTPAGYEASFLLAMYERDMGRPLAAAVLLQELVDTEKAASLMGPSLYFHAALAWRDAGQPELAEAALARLKERHAGSTITIAGQARPLYADGQDPLEWLRAVAGDPSFGPVAPREHWTTYRGNAARNGVAQGGIPHMQVRWRARVTNLPQLEGLLSTLRRGYQRRGIATLPATQPISVGDVVLMRTARNVVGVDFSTGNMVWDVRAEPDDAFEQLLAAAEKADAAESSPQLARALEQRMWDDAVYGTLSSDGERVYVIRGLSLSLVDRNRPQQFAGMAGGLGAAGRAVAVEAPTNTLTALDLKSEGKRAWEINGRDAGGKLDGAFFLGPPLCVDGRLYVLAEIRGSINLVVLRNIDAMPHWELEWMQQLANLEVGIDLDPNRRLAGAMPSYQGGVLICPTSAGVVVAVDVTKRSLLWAYRYRLREQELATNAAFGRSVAVEAPGVRSNDAWLDSTAVLADGKVLITPRESNELHCLDLATGNPVWKRRREDGLFLAGVHEGVVAIVGTDRISAVRLDNGLQAWANDHTLLPDAARPSGRGFLSDGKYFLPLTSAEVVAIDLYNGGITSRVRARDGQVLGNLIAHRGTIVAQSELLMEKYDQKDALRERTDALLDEDPSDPVALRNLGELALANGEIAEAVDFLKASLENDSNRDTRKMLASALLAGLEEDFSRFRDDLPLARQIASESEHLARLARVTAVGLQTTGDLQAAFRSFAELAAIDAAMPQMQAISRDWETQTGRWIRAQLAEIWESASVDERVQLRQVLREQGVVPAENAPAADALTFLRYFGSLPIWEDLASRVAIDVVETRPAIEAELTLEALARLDGLGEADWARSLRSQLLQSFETPNDQPPWPRGRILVERDAIEANERHDRFQSLRVDGPVDPSLHGYRFFLDQVNQSLAVVNPYGHQELAVPLAGVFNARRAMVARGQFHAVLSGHVLIASFGERIVAVDLLRRSGATSGNVLWDASTMEPFEGLAAQIVYPSPIQRSRSDGEFGAAGRRYTRDDEGRPLGWLGPAGPLGVVFQAQGELRSVDPLTGEVNWLRRDVPPGCVLFGDEEYVFALPHESTEATVFRALDGKRLGTRTVPGLEEHFEMRGRLILRWHVHRTGVKSERRLVLFDAWTGEAEWSQNYHIDAAIRTVEGGSVAVMDRNGKFEIVDIATGKVELTEQLVEEPTLERIFVFRSLDRIVLVTDQRTVSNSDVIVRAIDAEDFPIVTGRVYVLNRATGEPILPVPAEVEQQGLAVHQPVELPVIGFVRHIHERGGRGSRNNISMLVLNKATGGAIEPPRPARLYFPDASTTRFRMYREPEDADVLMIDMANHRVRMEFTDEAAAPEPPADSGVEGGTKKTGGGVWGIFRGG